MQNFLWPSEDLTSARYVKQPGTVITADQALAPDNTMTADLVDMSAAAVGTGWYQLSAIVGSLGSTITRSIWLRGQVGGEVVTLQDAAYSLGIKTVTLTSTWQLYTLTSTTGTTLASGLWIIKVSGNGYYAWGASMVNANWQGDYAKTTTGVINTGRPRDIVLKQNLLPYSEDMSKFILAASTLGSKVKNPINGAVTADVLVPTVGNAQHYCYLAVPSNPILRAGGVATYSALFKSYGWNWIRLQLAVAGGNVMAYFDIANGTVGTLIDGGQQILSADIKPFTNSYDTGWYEVSFTVKPAAGKVFGEAYFLVTDTDNTNFFVGDGVKGIAVFASQLTGVNWRGDYQPTNGSPVLNPIRNIIKKQNLVTYSTDLTKATTAGLGSMTVSGVGPKGEPNACYRITDTAVSGPHYASMATASQGLGTYTITGIIRPIAECSFSVVTSDGVSGMGIVVDGTTRQYYATTSTGTGISLLSYNIVELPNGLLEVSITVNFKSLPPATVSVPINQAKVTTWGWAYAGTGSAIEIYHTQMVKANWSGDLAFTNGTALTNPIRNIVQKQNLVNNSTNLSVAYNVTGIGSFTASGLGPNNEPNACTRITDNTNNSIHFVAPRVTSLGLGVYTVNAIVRPINGCSFGLVTTDGSSGNGIIVDGSTGTYSATTTNGPGVSLLNYSISNLPNGLLSVSVTVEFLSLIPYNVAIIIDKPKTAVWGWAYVGAGDAIEVYNIQLVKANWAGDYQPTTNTAITNPIRNIVQKQNLQADSNDLTAWTAGGATNVVAKAVVDGLNCNRVNIIGAGALSRNWYTKYRNWDNVWTGSLWIKRISTVGNLRIENPVAFGYGRMTIDLSLIGDGWFKVDTSKIQTGVTVAYRFKPNNTDGNIGMAMTSLDSSDISFYIAQPSFVTANWAGDYIPTVGSNLIENPIRNIVI